jgi:hypothetical protein
VLNGSYVSVIELIVKSTNNRIIYKIFGEKVSLVPLNYWMEFVIYAVMMIIIIIITNEDIVTICWMI